MINTILAYQIIADRDLPAISAMFTQPETLAEATARVKASTLPDEEPGEPDLD